jgi:hypothetical protein
MQRTLDSGRSFITSEELLFIHIDKTSLLKMPSGYTVNNYMQVTGMVTGENFAFFIYRHFVEIL